MNGGAGKGDAPRKGANDAAYRSRFPRTMGPKPKPAKNSK